MPHEFDDFPSETPILCGILSQRFLAATTMISPTIRRATFVKDDEAQFAEPQKGMLKQRLWHSAAVQGEPLYWLITVVVTIFIHYAMPS